MVRGEEKKEWLECDEYAQCITGWFEYFEVSEFEVFEWNDIEQQCNLVNKFENWTKNCLDDARCTVCPDTFMTSSLRCHARGYCDELNPQAQASSVKG
ncbi:MAG: hypothetical protein NT157_03930 [Candidatus Micrarchaeota archaeon]|nr:hypothetical protein [Candidatus Micrarchaeota archaeon]